MAVSNAKNTATSSENKKQTADNADNKDESATAQPAEWAQTILNQLIQSQKTWFEITSQQNSLLLETVSKVTEMRRDAPTTALSDWAKQGIEGFIEAQKRWSEIAGQQSEQILKVVQSNQNITSANQNSTQINAKAAAQQGHDALAKMQTAWLDFTAQQNAQMVGAMKETFKIDDASPAAALADFAQEAVNNYVDVQKRWLNLAMQLPFLGGNATTNEPKK